MRISADTRFPHPVLSELTGDYLEGEFRVELLATEDLTSGTLRLDHKIVLTEVRILDLVRSGTASIGCFIRCEDTFFTELSILSWPAGRTDFKSGALLGRVTLQPMIWLTDRLTGWDPGTIHEEFSPPVELSRGDVIALGPEHVMSIGQAKFTEFESIFELHRATNIPEGRMVIDPDNDRIRILVPSQLHDSIALLREQSRRQPVVMNGVYLPAVMEVLDLLTANQRFDDRRWYPAFTAKCDARGIRLGPGTPILESAQSLLENPLAGLAVLAREED